MRERVRPIEGCASRRAWLLLVGWVLPRPAAACPVCFGSADLDVLHAFYVSAALLTLLPLAIAAVTACAIAWLLRSPAAARSQISDPAADEPLPPGPS